MSIVYLEFLSDRTVQRAWESVNACLTEATLHMPSFWPQPPSPSWSAGSNYLLPSQDSVYSKPETAFARCTLKLGFGLFICNSCHQVHWKSDSPTKKRHQELCSHISLVTTKAAPVCCPGEIGNSIIWNDYLRNSRVTIIILRIALDNKILSCRVLLLFSRE